MFPLLQIGPLTLPVDGLLLIAGAWLGLELAERAARRGQEPVLRPNDVYGLAFAAIIVGFLGARLWYVARYLDSYLADPRAIMSLNANTLDTGGGLLMGLVAALTYGRRRRLPLRPTLDVFAPALAAFAVAVGVAHLASGNAFGAPADLPWAIELWDARRHPSQVYEIIAALAIFLSVRQLQRKKPYPGFLFLSWVALSSAARLFLEAFRGDSLIVAGSVRQPQLIALLVLLASLWLMGRWAQGSPAAGSISDSHGAA